MFLYPLVEPQFNGLRACCLVRTTTLCLWYLSKEAARRHDSKSKIPDEVVFEVYNVCIPGSIPGKGGIWLLEDKFRGFFFPLPIRINSLSDDSYNMVWQIKFPVTFGTSLNHIKILRWYTLMNKGREHLMEVPFIKHFHLDTFVESR